MAVMLPEGQYLCQQTDLREGHGPQDLHLNMWPAVGDLESITADNVHDIV